MILIIGNMNVLLNNKDKPIVIDNSNDKYKAIIIENLNKKQLVAVDKITEFVSQDIDKMFYLLGYAGTGKTYLISKVIKHFLSIKKMNHIFVCAPTHQALQNIGKYLRSNFTPAEQLDYLTKLSFMTIHKLLEFKPVIIAEDGSKVFKSTKESKFLKQLEDKLIIIDECSMISKEMVTELIKYTEIYPIKVIFLGDPKQLSPVKEQESLIFQSIPENYKYHMVLDEIMRTKSPDIKEVCAIIRNWNQKDSLSKLLLSIYNRKTTAKTFRLYHKKTNILDTSWFKLFIQKIDKNEIPIILVWKNNTADMYNTIIRKHIHETKDLDNYIVGDYVIFNDYYTSPEDATSFYTSNIIKILKITTEKKTLFDWGKIMIVEPKTIVDKGLNITLKKLSKLTNDFRVDSLTIERINYEMINATKDKTHLINTIHRDDLEEYHNMLEFVQNRMEFFFKKYKCEKMVSKLWDIFHKRLIDPYAKINFSHSITTHKAQGSTFGSVIVDTQDICENPDVNELQKLLYTAAGRAADELAFLL